MPGNKIGKLKAGQGVRRIQGQREGGWRDLSARLSYEVGSEIRPEKPPTDRPSRNSRWSGANGGH